MTRTQRIVLTSIALAVCLPICSRVARSENQGLTDAVRKTYTISGTVGASNVTLEGLPGVPRTDNNGVYSVQVPHGWTGKVVPMKEGYEFSPASKTYASIVKNHTDENYAACLLTFTISGNVGVADVTMKGLPGDPITDAKGNYVAQIQYGWSGTVTPTREGYEFDPEQLVYRQITADFSDHDYNARVLTYTISGRVGTGGVTMQGLPGHVVSASDGRYRAVVPYGWSGKVVPKKGDCVFEPASRQYQAIRTDQTSDDYRARPQTVVISDVIQAGPDGPIEGVTVVTVPGDTKATTDFQGRFAIEVPYGWSGQLKMAKPGYEFSSELRYDNVKHHLIDGERISAFEEPDIPAPRVSAMRPLPVLDAATSQVLVVPTSAVNPEELLETREDMQIMLQILREKLSEPRTIFGILYDYGDFFSNSRAAEALYLEGYGALFVLKVDFPLSFPSEPPAEETPESEVDPVWQRARQRLRTPGEGQRYRSKSASRATDEMSFEQFQKDLVETLRHAANIRHVDPNESIILTVIGQDDSAGAPYYRGVQGVYSPRSRRRADPYAERPVLFEEDKVRFPQYGDILGQPVGGQQASLLATVLTIQARKRDIDALTEGTFDFGAFRQRVKILSY